MDNKGKDPELQELEMRIGRLAELGVSIVHLMGGEPLLRADLGMVVRCCSSRGLVVMTTTNATLLSEQRVHELGEAGLDIIEVSTDGLREAVSRKTLPRQEKALALLLKYQPVFGYRIKLNTVLFDETIDELPQILGFIKDKPISITIGLAMPGDSHFGTEEGRARLFKAVEYIISQKKKGAKILDPVDYFRSFRDYLAGKPVWKCEAGKYMIEIDTDGKLLFCSYLLKKIDVDVMDLDGGYYSRLRGVFEAQLAECNRGCLANCFYDTAYFRRHPIYSLKNLAF